MMVSLQTFIRSGLNVIRIHSSVKSTARGRQTKPLTSYARIPKRRVRRVLLQLVHTHPLCIRRSTTRRSTRSGATALPDRVTRLVNATLSCATIHTRSDTSANLVRPSAKSRFTLNNVLCRSISIPVHPIGVSYAIMDWVVEKRLQ